MVSYSIIGSEDSLSDYRYKLRIEKAKQLSRDGRLSVMVISVEVGGYK